MKHKILISIDQGGSGSGFLINVKELLNTTHSKILTGISLHDYLHNKLVLTKGKDVAQPFKSIVSAIEYKLGLEYEAESMEMDFHMAEDKIDKSQLSILSSVADLLVIDRKVLHDFCGGNILVDLVNTVSCSVLILPETTSIESVIMMHDGSLSSIKAVKQFIDLFHTRLRDIPASVLLSAPIDEKAIENEKVFIDYIKLFFSNIGIQLMDDLPTKFLVKHIESTSQKPMLIASESMGNDILRCNADNRMIMDVMPVFIYKNGHK